jgi:hypothetical protein
MEDADLTHEELIHDLNNVFETITEAADLLSADRRWKALAATLSRSVVRGKRLLGEFPDSSSTLSSVVEGAIQSVTDYCIAARKPRVRFVRQLPADARLPGSATLISAQCVDKDKPLALGARSAHCRFDCRKILGQRGRGQSRAGKRRGIYDCAAVTRALADHHYFVVANRLHFEAGPAIAHL